MGLDSRDTPRRPWVGMARGSTHLEAPPAMDQSSASRCLSHCGECIAATSIAANILGWVAIENLTAQHWMREATHLMLNDKQLATRFGVHDILETVLILATLLGHETMLL